MNVKSIFIIFIIFLGIQSSFSEPTTLCENIVNRIFSPQKWKTYKPILAKDINNLSEDIRTKLFTNRTYRNISFIGLPLQGVHFQNCTFINVFFMGMDLSKTTFSQCNFKNVKIDKVKLTEEWIFDPKESHVNLMKKYSDSINKKNDHAARIFNEFIFKNISIKLKNCDLSTYNLQGIQLENANLHNVILRQVRDSQLKTCTFSNVDLQNTDLTTTSFDGNKCDKVNINNALLYSNITCNAQINPLQYVQFYSHLMNTIQENPGNLDFIQAINKGSSIERFNLSKQNLSGLNLKGICLRYTNLEDADLRNTDLTKADLTGANLYCAQLQRAILNNTNLTAANLSSAKLQESILKNSNLTAAELSSANLQGAKLSDTLILKYDRPNDLFQKWVDAEGEHKELYQKLTNANFIDFRDLGPEFIDFLNSRNKTQSLDLKYVKLRMDLRGADFEGVDLSYADFSWANLTNARFKGAMLKNTDFCWANLTNTRFKGAILKNTDFCNANLTQADFRGADITATNILIRIYNIPNIENLKDTKFTDTLTINIEDKTQVFRVWIGPEGKDKDIAQWLINIQYPVLNEVSNQDLKNYINDHPERHLLELSNAYLKGAQLQGVNLSDVNLPSANLNGANLTETLFINADLRFANLENSILNKTNFKRANLFGASYNWKDFKDNDEVNFEDACFQKFSYLGVLQNKWKLPSYNHSSELFDLLVTSSRQEKEKYAEEHAWDSNEEEWISKNDIFTDKTGFLHKLINSRVNMFAGVPHEKLSAYFNNRDKTQILNLYNSNFEGVDLHGIDFSNADLRKANFKNANLKDANLTGAKISDSYSVIVGYPEEYNDKDFYEEVLLFWHLFDQETQEALQAILIAKGFNLENQEPTAKRIKIEDAY